MDLIDLFIGAEGTLGVHRDVTLRVVARPASLVSGLRAIHRFPRGPRIRSHAPGGGRETWRSRDPGGLDISAIEHMDAPVPRVGA